MLRMCSVLLVALLVGCQSTGGINPVTNGKSTWTVSDAEYVAHLKVDVGREGYFTSAGGFLINYKGRNCLITVGHIVYREKGQRIRSIAVAFRNNRKKYYGARLIQNDLRDSLQMDLSLLKLEGKYRGRKARLGDSNKLKPNDTLFAVGHPNKQRWVSAALLVVENNHFINKTFSPEFNNGRALGMPAILVRMKYKADRYKFVYGASGSAVFNANGEIVGMIYAVNRKDPTIAYVAPINHILKWLDHIIKKGKI